MARPLCRANRAPRAPPAWRWCSSTFRSSTRLSVAENIALGMESPPPLRDLSRRIRDVSETYGLPLDPHRIVGDLSAGERQRVEILRCLLQNPRAPDHGRADLGLDPARGRDPVPDPAQTRRRRRRRSSISPTSSRKSARCVTAPPSCGWGASVGTCDPRETTAREMAEMMVGTTLHVRPAAHARPAQPPLNHRPLARLAQPLRHGTEGTCISQCARAKSWASAASRATGRMNCSRHCQASCAARPANPAQGPPDWRARPRSAPPPGAADRPRGTARPRRRPRHEPDRKRPDDRRRARRTDGARLHQLGRRTGFRRAHYLPFRRAHAGPRHRRARTFGRQPAEIRHRPRGSPAPRGADRQPAHLGRRCRRRRGDPAGAAGSRRRRRRGSRASARISTN